MKAMLLPVVAVVVLGAWCGMSLAVEQTMEGKESHEKLLQMLPHSSVSLSEGVRKLIGSSSETVLSAKFELNDKGELMLSVYVAEKGLKTPIAKNVLKEISTSAEAEKWKAETEVLKDKDDIAAATEQYRLLGLSHDSLLDVLGRAEKEHQGVTFVAIYPTVRDRKEEFLVSYAEGKMLAEAWYGFGEGKKATEKHKEWVPYGSTYGAPYK